MANNTCDIASRPLRQLAIGLWHVHPDRDEIERDGASLKLEPRTMRLLLTLAQQPGALVPTEQLLDTVWPDVVVCQSSLYQAIAQLRRALGDDPDSPAYIATVPRRGYRLVAPVTHAPPASVSVERAAAVPDVSAVALATPVANHARWRVVPLGAAALAAVAAIATGLLAWLSPSPGTLSLAQAAQPVQMAALGANTTRRILWVDDNPTNNTRERRSLEALGLRVDTAHSTDEALRWLQHRRADVVISDMGRPPDHSAGYTLLEAMRRRGTTLPYLIYTAACSPSQDADARERGALVCTDKTAVLIQHVMLALQTPPTRVAGDEPRTSPVSAAPTYR